MPVDLPSVDFEPPVFDAVDLDAVLFESPDFEVVDFAPADFVLSDLVPADLDSDLAPLDAFLPAARAAAVVSATDFGVADAFGDADFVVLLVVALVAVLFEEALFSEAPDFILEEVSLVLPFVVVAMVSVV